MPYIIKKKGVKQRKYYACKTKGHAHALAKRKGYTNYDLVYFVYVSKPRKQSK